MPSIRAATYLRQGGSVKTKTRNALPRSVDELVYLTKAEAAAIARISVRTIERHAAELGIEGPRGARRIRLERLLAWLAAGGVLLAALLCALSCLGLVDGENLPFCPCPMPAMDRSHASRLEERLPLGRPLVRFELGRLTFNENAEP